MAPLALIPIALQLAQFAPQLMRFLGVGEASTAVVERVVGVAQTVAGVKTPEEALAAITASAEMQTKFRLAVLAADGELERAYLSDRASARDRDIAYVRAGRYNWRADILALLSVGGLLVCVWLIARDAGMPQRAIDAILIVIGVLAAAVRDVFSFEFGSSRGSEQKQQQLNEMLSRKD
jgi:hypothetical protein